MTYMLVTNNSKVDSDTLEVIRVQGLFLDVLEEARRLVHLGYRLEVSPLPASHRMLFSPTRTILLSKGQGPDQESLFLMEKELEKYKLTMGEREPDIRHLEDYEILDLDLFESALEELGIRK